MVPLKPWARMTTGGRSPVPARGSGRNRWPALDTVPDGNETCSRLVTLTSLVVLAPSDLKDPDRAGHHPVVPFGVESCEPSRPGQDPKVLSGVRPTGSLLAGHCPSPGVIRPLS
jgi:hypothetical protein